MMRLSEANAARRKVERIDLNEREGDNALRGLRLRQIAQVETGR